MVYEVNINDLSTWIANQPTNYLGDPYEIQITGITTENYNLIRQGLNHTYYTQKWFDLRPTEIPEEITDWGNMFAYCECMEYAPSIPDTVTNLDGAFSHCVSLRESPVLPDVTSLIGTFLYCHILEEAPEIPSTVTSMYQTFENCYRITEMPDLPEGLIDLSSAFDTCSSLRIIKDIPSSVQYMNGTFNMCRALQQAPAIPEGVLTLTGCFIDCTSLEVAPYIPSTITDFAAAFRNCTSLEEISCFRISQEALMTDGVCTGCFYNCISLTSIYVDNGQRLPAEDWCVMSLKLSQDNGDDYVGGKVYYRDQSYVSIPQTKVDKTTLELPIFTDELMFTDNYTDSDLEEIILKSIQYGYSYWNKLVLDVTKENFVLYAKYPENFVSNIDFNKGGVPVGFIGAYFGTTDPEGWFICDGRDTSGTDIEIQTHFPELYTFLGNSNVLPDLRNKFIEGANNDVGTYVAAGIPNITGTTQHVQYMGGASGSGAFSRGDSSSNNSAYNGNTTKTQRITFNAKNGETKTDGTLKGANDTKVYGESDTVQPASLRLNYIIKAI